MKTIETKVYQFEELSKEAKQTAIQRMRESEYEIGYAYSNDAIKSLQKLAEAFNSELKDYKIDWFEGYRNVISFDVPEYVQDWNKKQIASVIKSLGSYNKDTLRGDGECKLTGFCMDEDAIDGVRIAFLRGGITEVKELLMAGYKSWFKACNSDAEYQISDEGITETIEGNDYEFTEDGKRF